MKMWKKLLPLMLSLLLAGCFRESATPVTSAQLSPAQVPPTRPVASKASNPAQTTLVGADDTSLLLGNPSLSSDDPDNYLIERPQHAMSYNKANGGPNWVAWHLDKGDLGNVRRGDFLPDPLLPQQMQIRPNDYRGSGYDRGHVCPSGDRTRSREDNTATFVMSNMLPQAAALNQQVWKDLEDYSRSLVRSGANELYTIAGGTGSAERIADGRVNVPTVCWKIILVLPLGDNDLQRINADTRVIAVAMPNRQRQEIADSKWSDWITSVAQLEKTTGYDFLSTLPDDVERVLEQKVDSGRARSASRAVRDTDSTRTISDPLPLQIPSEVIPQQQIPRSESPQKQAPTYRDSAPQVQEQPAVAGQVWVNTNSGIYHYPGTRWYGNTKEGAYMSEQEALAQGHRAARNGQ